LLQLALEPEPSIELIAVDEQERAIPWLNFTVRQGEWYSSGFTDADGHVSFAFPQGGSYGLFAGDAEELAVAPVVVAPPADERAALIVRVSSRGQ
jgi:hypothetical protein